MSGSLLKSSKWYVRPPHLKKSVENNPLPPPNIDPPTRPEHRYIPPEEEFCIRQFCPVTLNHLLPDLILTQKHDLEKSTSEYDINMVIKFEKHLEESHSAVSCSNSSDNEDGELEDEKESDDCIESDINLHILQNGRLKLANKLILKPHIVNYPEPDMKESILAATLNNKHSIPSRNQMFPTTLECAQNVQRISSEIENKRYAHFDGDVYDIMIPFKNNKQIQPLHESKGLSFKPSKTCEDSVDKRIVKQFNPFDEPYTPVTPKIDNTSFPGSRSREDMVCRLSSHLTLLPRYSTPSTMPRYSTPSTMPIYSPPCTMPRPSLCVQHRRCRSLPPFKTTQSLRAISSVLPKSQENSLIIPSPHLIQLARLKKEELELQEKIFLRNRQILELERLRSPAEKWYEMKSYRFHQETHKNTVFLRNENNLPLIRQRRQQLLDVLSAPQT